ncbi:hypothetical protein [Cloacibacterium sp.]|uniref:hypothetical protein n=1 Tax=Cloacibacterium sp. TaxID=1913682 RepID=UPI0039E365BB
MKKIIYVSLFLISIFLFSQEKKFQPIYYVDYQYAGENQLKVGNEFMLYNNQGKYVPNLILLGIGGGISYSKEKIYFIPDLYFRYNYGIGYFKLGTTNQNLYSFTGLSIFNYFDVGLGYSKSYNNSNLKLNGLSIELALKLTKRKDIADLSFIW